MLCLTNFWTSVVCLVIVAWSPTATQSDGRSRGATKCPTDVREETRRCLGSYREQLDALERSDYRFFPGLDVEVIRALCSLLEDSIRCAQLLNDACQKTQELAIEEELSAEGGVGSLCLHKDIYEEYAVSQNCFVRLRSESESCLRNFQQSIRSDEIDSRSSSASSSSQRHHAQQQRQYCSHVSRLINCVKSHVRANPSFCVKTALNLVGHLVRASLPPSVGCSDEQNATSSPTTGKARGANQYDGSTSGGTTVAGPSRRFHLLLFVACFYLCSLARNDSTSSLPPPTTTSLPHHRRRRHHHL